MGGNVSQGYNSDFQIKILDTVNGNNKNTLNQTQVCMKPNTPVSIMTPGCTTTTLTQTSIFTPSLGATNLAATQQLGAYLNGKTDALNSFGAFGVGGVGVGVGGIGSSGNVALDNAYANYINTQADILRRNNSTSGKFVDALVSNPQLMGAAANGIGAIISGIGNGIVAGCSSLFGGGDQNVQSPSSHSQITGDGYNNCQEIQTYNSAVGCLQGEYQDVVNKQSDYQNKSTAYDTASKAYDSAKSTTKAKEQALKELKAGKRGTYTTADFERYQKEYDDAVRAENEAKQKMEDAKKARDAAKTTFENANKTYKGHLSDADKLRPKATDAKSKIDAAGSGQVTN